MYGTTTDGGSFGNSVVFKMNSDGSNFTNLHSFSANPSFLPYSNTDGAYPTDLIVMGDRLYGAASGGGSLQGGTLFAVNTDGSGFTARSLSW